MRNITPALATLFIALGVTTFAQPGSLDGDFDGDGKVTTDFALGYDLANSVAIQADGQIVVAGYAFNGTNYDFAVARYNTDGTLDNSFNAGGKVTTAFGNGSSYGASVAIQSDGKILVAGSADNGANSDFAVVRYNTDGTLDNSFSVDGKLTTDFGSNDVAVSVAIQSDGKIVVAGSTYGADHDFAVARYNADGSLDNSFSVDGKLTTDFGMGEDSGSSVAIQPDGKIILAGTAYNGAENDFAMTRYNTDGTLDNSFSVDGKVITDFGTTIDFGNSVAIQPDGKIVMAGTTNSGLVIDFAMARYNPDGTLDNSFSANGKVTTDFGTFEFGTSVAIQADGKILVAGRSSTATTSVFALVRYNVNGTLDNSFSTGGIVTTAFGMSADSRASVAIQPDGKIVVAGTVSDGTNGDFAVARYISGLNMGIIDLSIANTSPLIYPNPIKSHATLQYKLQNAETISIHLLDMQGRTVQTFIEGQHQAAGEHQQAIDLPETLPSGSYLIAISSPTGKLTVQVVK